MNPTDTLTSVMNSVNNAVTGTIDAWGQLQVAKLNQQTAQAIQPAQVPPAPANTALQGMSANTQHVLLIGALIIGGAFLLKKVL